MCVYYTLVELAVYTTTFDGFNYVRYVVSYFTFLATAEPNEPVTKCSTYNIYVCQYARFYADILSM